MKTQSQQLFSQSAVDRLASPEHMNDLLTFGSVGLWTTLLAVLGILAGVVCWGLFGKVTTDVSARGILLNGNLLNIESLGEGQVQSVLIAPGAIVHAGDAVAIASEPQDNEQLAAVQATLADLERQRAAFAAISSDQNQLQATSVDQQRSALQVQIGMLERQREQLQAQQTTEHGLLSKGLITHAESAATDQELNTLESTLATRKASFSELANQRFRTVSSGRMETLELDEQIDSTRHRLDALQKSMGRTTTVRSTTAGQVVEVSVRPGMIVHAGTTVAELQSVAGQLTAMVWVSAADAKQVSPGMSVQLSPAGYKMEEYGFLRGTVKRVSSFPVSSEMLMATVANDSLAKGIGSAGPVHQVEVTLEPAGGAPGHFQWSSPRGQAIALTAGTSVAGQIVVRAERPGNLVIPYLRKTLGVR